MAQVIAHLDMDCFFCSCELLKDPSLKGKPVMVGATGDRGVISAANYEARTFGVFSATPISKARRLCPEGIYLKGDFKFYKQKSNEVMRILESVSDDLIQVSIDEAYLDITTLSREFSSKQKLGEFIQYQVEEATGLSCSVGIGYCKTVAKMGSDFKKPHGVTIITNPTDFLRDLPIEKFPGIGKKSKLYYHKKNVKTIGDLIDMDRFEVLDKFGMHGVKYQQIALGQHQGKWRRTSKSRSISNERTFFEDQHNVVIIKEKLDELCERVQNRLGGYSFKTISLKLRYHDFTTITRDFTLPTASRSLPLLRNCIQFLIEKESLQKPIRLVGVKLGNLIRETAQQQSLLSYTTSEASHIPHHTLVAL